MSGKRADALLVLGVALSARLAVVAWAAGRFPPADDGHFYDVLAQRLAQGQGYTWLWPDGAVTYAAHYPVGYPALLALSYRLVATAPAVAMTVNAVVGALGALGAHALVRDAGVSRGRAVAAGLAVALHPALVPYTAALMTEGVTAALLMVAAALASRARARASEGPPRFAPAMLVASALVVGLATLVRPQSILFAPVLGALALPAPTGLRRRLATAALASGLALAVVAPWTVRNCARMHRCALVSVNGGWNLLIGAQTRRGGWEPIDVPPACATVWDEAGKDACFERAGRELIAAAPAAWLARAPGKLATTFDYFGAAPYYLHQSNPAALGERAQVAMAVVETVFVRLALLGALAAVALWKGPRRAARAMLALAGGLTALGQHGWPAYLALALSVVLLGPRAWARTPMLVPAGAALVLLTAATHATFFGAGRYGLVVVPFVTALAFLAFLRVEARAPRPQAPPAATPSPPSPAHP